MDQIQERGGNNQLAFNSRMLNVYNLSDKNEIVTAMITHMAQQIENPALSDSKFIFKEVVRTDLDSTD